MKRTKNLNLFLPQDSDIIDVSQFSSNFEKLDEIADVFITAMNIAIHSGFTADEMEEAISNKIKENYERLSVEKKKEETV